MFGQHIGLMVAGALIATFGYALTASGYGLGVVVLGVGGAALQIGIIATGVRLGMRADPLDTPEVNPPLEPRGTAQG